MSSVKKAGARKLAESQSSDGVSQTSAGEQARTQTRKRKNNDLGDKDVAQQVPQASKKKVVTETVQEKTPAAAADGAKKRGSKAISDTSAPPSTTSDPTANIAKETVETKTTRGTVPKVALATSAKKPPTNEDEGDSDSSNDSDSVVSGDRSGESGDEEKVQFAGRSDKVKTTRKRSTNGPKERNKTSRKNRVFTAEDDLLITQAVQAAIARKIHVNWSALGDSMGRMGCICRRRWFRHLSLQFGEEMQLTKHVKTAKPITHASTHPFATSSELLADLMNGGDGGGENVEFGRKPRHTFTAHDDEFILQAVREAHTDGTAVLWEEVAAPLQRTGQACKQRWKLSLAPRHPELALLPSSESVLNLNYTPIRKPRQAFTEPEDAYIVHTVRTAHTSDTSVQWEEVGEALQRTGQACKQRWLLTLASRHPEVSLLLNDEASQVDSSVPALAYNPNRKVRQTFTDLDDSHILHAVRTAQGEGKEVVWREVGVPLDRTGEACKQRWRLTLALRHPELSLKG